MLVSPILLIGGAGFVGRGTAALLRETHLDVPLLIAGRHTERAEAMAQQLGNARAAALDWAAADLRLGDQPVSAVVVYFTDTSTAALRFAQTCQVPYISISPAMYESGPEIAAFVHAPDASPIVLGTEWLVGATTIPTLEWAKAFSQIDTIRIGAVLDERDEGGAAAQDDLYRQTRAITAVQNRRDGHWGWRTGDARHSEFRTLDGTLISAEALTIHDVYGLAAETQASNVEFHLAIRAHDADSGDTLLPAEILIELSGTDLSGQPHRTRHAVTHSQGQMPLTSLGVALLVERLLGLNGKPAVPPGLYFPYQLIDFSIDQRRLRDIGGKLLWLSTNDLTFFDSRRQLCRRCSFDDSLLL